MQKGLAKNMGGEYIGYRVKDNEKLAPDDNELCPVTFALEKVQQ